MTLVLRLKIVLQGRFVNLQPFRFEVFFWGGIKKDLLFKASLSQLALAVGFEPTTDRLTADSSTAELRQNRQ